MLCSYELTKGCLISYDKIVNKAATRINLAVYCLNLSEKHGKVIKSQRLSKNNE